MVLYYGAEISFVIGKFALSICFYNVFNFWHAYCYSAGMLSNFAELF